MRNLTKYVLTFFCAALGLTLITPVAFAQKAQIELSVSQQIANLGDELRVQVQINIDGRSGFDRYQPPSFDGFSVIDSGSSQNVQIINFSVRRGVTYTYLITPTREGKLTIGPASIFIGGREIKSSNATIQVSKGAGGGGGGGGGQALPRRRMPLGGNPPGFPQMPQMPGFPQMPSMRDFFEEEQQEGQDEPIAPRGAVFIQAAPSTKKAYVGQQIIVTWLLFTQTDIAGFQMNKMPTSDGFWSEDLRSPQRLEFERHDLNGRQYYAAVIVRKALFPQRTGTLMIGPLEAQVRTRASFFRDDLLKRSEEVPIEVQPLPAKGQPANFSSTNIGEFGLAASVDRAQIKAGEALTLKVIVRGSGNLRQLKMPQLEQFDGFKVYEPKITDQFELNQQVSGERIYEYLLMPTRGGKLTVPALSLDYFDPKSGTYKKATSTPLNVTVIGQVTTPPPSAGQLSAQQNVIGPTIRPPHTVATLTADQPPLPHRHWWFWVLLLIPPLTLGALTGGELLLAKMRQETPGSRRRRANRQALRHLRNAKALANENNNTGFFSELDAALRSILDQKMNGHSEGLTHQELAKAMTDSKFSEELVALVQETMERYDLYRFAPSMIDQKQRENELAQAESLVEKLSRKGAK